jgi:hypothetical protein
MRILVLCAALILAGCAHTQSVAEKVSLGCVGADLATTAYGTLVQEAVETNPLFTGDDQFERAESLAINAVASVGLNYAIRWLVKKADINPWFGFGPIAGIRCGGAAINLKVIVENE